MWNQPFSFRSSRANLAKRFAALSVVVGTVAALSSGLLRGSMPDVQTGTWVATGSLSAARGGSAAVLLPSGAVLVAGGAGESGSVDTVDLFGADGSFTAGASMSEARDGHAAVLLKDGRVLVVGGRNANGALTSAEIYADGVWTAISGLTDARWGHTATVLADGRVLVAGGENGSAALMSVELFDPETGVFAVAGTMATARKGHAAARLSDGRVMIAGGATDDTVLSTTEIFDPQTLQLSAGPALNTPRWGLTATRLLDGRVLFIGGYNGTQNAASAEIYSEVTNAITFTASATPMVARRNHQAILLPNNNAVLVVGGVAEAVVDGVLTARETSAAELFVPWLNEVWQTGAMSVARAQVSGAALSTESYGAAPAGEGLVMVAGGAGQASSESYRFATIRVDKDDYAPGEKVFVSGSGWQPLETVTLALRELPAEHPSRFFTIDADESGRIDSTFLFDVEEHHLGVRFYLNARGAASQAQVTFTDAYSVNSVTIGTQTPNPVSQGTDVTYQVSVSFSGNNNSPCTANLSITGLPPGATASWSTLTVTSAAGTSVLTIGTGGVTPNPTPAPAYSFTVTATMAAPNQGSCNSSSANRVGTLRVSNAITTTTSASNVTATYGDAAATLSALVSPASGPAVGTGTVTFGIKSGATTIGSVTSGTVTAGSASASFPLTGVNAGSYTIEAVYNPDSGFSGSNNATQTPPPTLTISPKVVTGSFTANNKPYDGTTAATIATRTLAGVHAGDTLNVSLTGGTAAFADALVANSKTVTATGFTLSGSAAVNYSLGSVTSWTSTANITPISLTPAVTVANKPYDGNTTATISNRTFTNAGAIIVEDDVTLTGGTATFSDKNAGLGKPVNVADLALGGADAVNYVLSSTTATAAADIAFRAITVTADAKSKVYGDADPALTYQITLGSLVDGDALTGDLTREAGTNVGSYAIQQGTLSGGSNYELTFAGANLSITPRGITVTADAKTKVYGDADPALTHQITVGSLVDGDALTGDLTREAGTDVGSYAIQQGTLTAGSNYELTFTGANLTITARPITVTAAPKSKVYGDADPTLTYAISIGTLVNGDTFTGALTRDAGESVGNHPITQGTLALTTNYNLSFVGGTFTITARPVTVTANAGQTKVYGEADPLPFAYGLTGTLVNGDTFSGELTRAAGENVGAYAIQQGTLSLSTNYNLTFVAADFSITKRPATIVADAKTKIYGDVNPMLTATVSSTVNGDALAYSLSTTAMQFSGVGSYPIAISLGSNPNYDVTPTNGSLAIMPRAATVTADTKSKVYGDANPALTATVTGTVNGDALAYTLATAVNQATGIGAHPITVSLGANPNYAVTPANGTLTITPRAITVTADAKVKILNAPDPLLTHQITAGNLVNGDAFGGSLSRSSGEAIGTYAIQQGTLSLGANYALTFVASSLKIVYRWDGFLQPITNTAHDQQQLAVYSSFKTGQTIPVKFELKDASGGIVVQSGSPVFSRTGNLGSCGSPEVPEDLIGVIAPDSDGLFKQTGSQYHYGWNTKGLAKGLYLIFANLADGTQQSAAVCLTK